MTRIEFLDGLRGLAILLVVFYHAFSRWPELVPYGDVARDFPLFYYGYFGVQLFFLISGFVILMTLERCSGFLDFAFRRWLRLFPAMLICSLLIFLTAPIFHARPYGQPNGLDLVPGLVFTEPHLLSQLLPVTFGEMEGVYWTLYVEAKFYLFAGALFFLIGSRALTYTIFLMSVASFALVLIDASLDNSLVHYLAALTTTLSFNYFCWFGAGCAFYLYKKTSQSKWFVIGLGMAISSSLFESAQQIPALIAGLLVSALFSGALVSATLQRLLSSKFLVFFGFISYPLYLIHENMMIATIVQATPYLSFIPQTSVPFLAIGLVTLIAYVIARYAESRLKFGLRGGLLGMRDALLART